MNEAGYKEWLNNVLGDKSPRYRKDLLSRAKRIEKTFKKLDKNFSLDEEYKKDKGLDTIDKLAVYGKKLEGTGIELPIGTNQMCPILAAAKWYFKFLTETEGK